MTKTTALSWESPPEGTRRFAPDGTLWPTYDWSAIADQLRARPYEWARIFDRDRASLATAIRIHGIKALDPSAGYEVTTANNTRDTPTAEWPRLCTMFLRYNPDKDMTK